MRNRNVVQRDQVQVLRGVDSDANLQDYALAKLLVCRDRDRVEIHRHTYITHDCRYNIPSCGGGADITVKLRYLSGAAVLDGVYLIEGCIYIVMLIERINAPSIIRRKDARKTRP